ncbi:FAD-dependent oxidoreductase [Streptomyces venezuelae]|uniref:FAD-dependent oxidoreductase n=1 Tax=Streptomyces venezuelae TaxID=54571 RepID=A0A5P2CVZ2_STRVZ|nr:FAD-dependent monooxygenase [Streptomyces venezuelae]QES46613.1 FAD-dependent oxidoreductase [Streptomyces venezuelae]
MADSTRTQPVTVDCVIVGAGPAGTVLAYLLARGGASVLLLESRGDFDRRFRGDTLAPRVLDYLDSLGLAERMLDEIPHARAHQVRWTSGGRTWGVSDYRLASKRHPYYALIPQALFLAHLVAAAEQYSGFRIEMNSRASRLLKRADGRVVGVEYTRSGVRHPVHAGLVVATDGRNSKLRQLSGIQSRELGAHLDILWFTLPRRPETDPALSGLDLFSGRGTFMALLNQVTTWQLGYTIPAGSMEGFREKGVTPLHDAVRETMPWLSDRITELTDVNQLTLLSVRITELDRWWRPGLLLLGDAAHVISPVGGNGINFAIADAAEAGNRLLPVVRGGANSDEFDSACVRIEAARRPSVTREQRSQIRIERSSVARLRAGAPGPALPLRVIATVPGLPALSGWRAARAIRIPAPSREILGTVLEIT